MSDKAVCVKPIETSKKVVVNFRTVELDMWSAPGWEVVRQGAKNSKGAAASSSPATKTKSK